MSEDVERMAARLEELAKQLRDPELSLERADELTREAADLAAKVGAALEAALREAKGA
jgi:hypothetical protein